MRASRFGGSWRRNAGRNTYTIALLGMLGGLLAFTLVIKPTFGAFDLETLSKGARRWRSRRSLRRSS